uniref:Electron transporter n=1 Tax=Solanum tuberosum TaxID=4113 RepID=M1CVF5_SOLTU
MENRSNTKGIRDLPVVRPTPIEGDVIRSHTVSEDTNHSCSSHELPAKTTGKHVKGARSDMNLFIPLRGEGDMKFVRKLYFAFPFLTLGEHAVCS